MSAESDYFSQYLTNKSPYQSQDKGFEEKGNTTSSKEFSFDDFVPEKASEESKLDSILRQSTQYGSRALERIGGVYPDMKKFIVDMVIESYEKAALIGSGDQEKQREAPEWLKRSLQGDKSTLGAMSQGLTSPELQEVSEKVSGGYTSPKTPGEEKIGSLIGDITSSLLGGKKSIKNNLLVPLGANLIEETLDLAGFDKSSQAKGKAGSWFLMGLAANTNANKFASELQTEARNNIVPSQSNMNKLGTELRPLERQFIAGDVRSASAKGQIKDIISDLKSGKNTVDDLITRIDAINAEIEMKGGWDYSTKTPPKVRKAEIRNLNKVKGAIYNTLEDSLQNQPGAFKKLMDAQQATGAIGASNKFMDFARKHWGKSISVGLGSLLGGLYLDPAYAVMGSAALLAAHKAGQIGMRMAKSPVLKKYYLEAVKGAAENNVPVFVQNMTKLDRAMEKEEKKQKIPYKFQEE